MSGKMDIKKSAGLTMGILEKIVQLESLLKNEQVAQIITRKTKAMRDEVLLYIVNDRNVFETQHWQERMLAIQILVDRRANYLDDERKRIIEKALFNSAYTDRNYKVERRATEILNETVAVERIIELITEDFLRNERR